MEEKIKHLEMIQEVICRMANNSFLLKGWAVTLEAGIFALSSKDTNYILFLVAYIPLILFWMLDSYFLLLEKKYRSLYDYVRNKKNEEIDFSMNILDNPHNKDIVYFQCFFSIIEIGFYLPSIILIAAIMKFVFKS